MRLFFPLRPVDLRSFFLRIFFSCVALRSARPSRPRVGFLVSWPWCVRGAADLRATHGETKSQKNELRSTSNEIKKKLTWGHTPSTRMEIRTWRSAIADLKGSPPEAPSGVLGKGNPGWVWRCDAAISRYKEKTCLFGRFFTCCQNTKMTPFSLIPKVLGHV